MTSDDDGKVVRLVRTKTSPTTMKVVEKTPPTDDERDMQFAQEYKLLFRSYREKAQSLREYLKSRKGSMTSRDDTFPDGPRSSLEYLCQLLREGTPDQWRLAPGRYAAILAEFESRCERLAALLER